MISTAVGGFGAITQRPISSSLATPRHLRGRILPPVPHLEARSFSISRACSSARWVSSFSIFLEPPRSAERRALQPGSRLRSGQLVDSVVLRLAAKGAP
jgi:hypothetical protein